MLCRLGNGFNGETAWRGGVLFDIIFFEKARCISYARMPLLLRSQQNEKTTWKRTFYPTRHHP